MFVCCFWPSVYLVRFNLNVAHGFCVNEMRREPKIPSIQLMKVQKNDFVTISTWRTWFCWLNYQWLLLLSSSFSKCGNLGMRNLLIYHAPNACHSCESNKLYPNASPLSFGYAEYFMCLFTLYYSAQSIQTLRVHALICRLLTQIIIILQHTCAGVHVCEYTI